METTQVAVIGAGIGGLALALALHDRGIAAQVVDRRPAVGLGGSGMVLMPNAVKALDLLRDGWVGKRVRDAGWQGAPGVPHVVLNTRGRRLTARVPGDLEARWGAPMIAVLRPELLSVLLAAVRDAGIPVRLGTACESVEFAADHATAVFADGTRLRASVLAGTDGLRSVVRAAVAGQAPPRYLGYTSVHGIVGARSAEFAAGCHTLGAGGSFCTVPLPGGCSYWVARLAAAEGEWPAKTAERMMSDLLARMGSWPGPVAALIEDTPLAMFAPADCYDRDPVGTWSRQRVTLAGDAAHPLSPALAQGAAMALEDAICLASLLAGTAELGTELPAVPGATVAAALASYERRRRARTAGFIREARRHGATLIWHGRFSRWYRDQLARTASHGKRDARYFSYEP
jgi:2-polyprenyl-6-methoxyphenol hydroxylase-like FAD-dependent oxidoreductase